MKNKVIVLILLIPDIVFSQYLSKDFMIDNLDRCVITKLCASVSSNDSIFFLNEHRPISGLFLSGNVILHDNRSYVRVTIEDNSQNEYLVYETYPLISDNKCSFSAIGMESVCLDNIIVKTMKVEARHAFIRLDSIYYIVGQQGKMSNSVSIKEAQCEYIANKINSKLIEDNKPWRAGVTEIAMLTFEEKKALFGGIVPFLYGYDYYKSGIFVMPEYEGIISNKSVSTSSTNYVIEWDWRNRHGKNWMTPVKNQSSCGSCWAFSAIGTFESYINLYYNQLINYDLSEQEVLSCSGAGTCSSGNIGGAFNHIKASGSIPENCFSYSATNELCSNQCANPDDRLSFEQYSSILANEDSIKKALFKSPISFGNSPWFHFLVLAGYKQIQSGENYFISGNSNYSVTILPDDPLVGETAWLVKNSWGNSWGDSGYGYIAMSLSDAYGIYKISGEISSVLFNNNDIICEDTDNDGYYFWGIGPKPNNCPICCPDIPDGDDSNSTIGELDEYGNPLAYSFPYSTTTINSNTTWNTNQTHCGNIVVTNGATLTITAELTMNPAAKIIVQNGGVLTVDCGSIVNAKIEVLNSAKIQLLNNGTLYLKQLGNLSIQLGGEANLDYGRVLIE